MLMQTILEANFLNFFLADIFNFDANENTFLFSRISYFYINSKNGDDLTSASYFHMLPVSTLVEPNQMLLDF